MLQSANRLLVSLALSAALLASGCIDVAQIGGPEEPVAEETPFAGRSGSSRVAWETGSLWHYAVAGSLVDDPGFFAYGVVKEDPSGYLVATSNPEESARAVAGAGAPFVGKVERDSLSPYVEGRPRDFLGLQRESGTSWEEVFLGSAFTLVKSGPTQIDGSPGHRVAGAATDGRSLVAEYNEAVGWFTKFEVRDEEGDLLIGHRHSDRAGPSPVTLETWTVLDAHRTTAFQDSMGYAQWTSSGIADRLVVSVHVRDDKPVQRSGSPQSSSDGGLIGKAQDLLGGLLGARSHPGSSSASAVATLLAPGDVRVFESESERPGITIRTTADREGIWQMVASTGGPSVEIVVYQVAVTTYGAS